MAAECISPGVKSKRVVTFAATHTSILIPINKNLSPLKARERARALRARKATPRKKTPRDETSRPPSPAMNRLRGKKPRLVESGAVRVQFDRNPRRGNNDNNHVDHTRGRRLVDRGAVRVNVTRRTTPRRLYASRKRMYSPPPPSRSGTRSRAPQSEIACRRPPDAHRSIAPTPSHERRPKVPQSERIRRKPPMADQGGSFAATPTPSKNNRSNARTGGHRFRSTFSPYYATPSTPAITEVLYEEEKDGDSICLELERGLSRTLFG